MKIRFIKNYQVKAAGGQEYKAGQVVEVESSSATHFISRGAAVELDTEAEAKAKAEAEAKAKAEAEANEEKPLEEMTKAELQALLDEKGVEYKSNDNKDALLELVLAAE